MEQAKGGEIDTAVPFHSVRAAVSMFGERAGPRTLRTVNFEKRANKNEELQHVQEDLAKSKELLLLAETAKRQAVTELEETKKRVEITNRELEAALALQSSTPHSNSTGSSAISDENSSIALREELERFKQKHADAVVDLDAAKLEINKLKAELKIPTSGVTIVHEVAARTDEAVQKAKNLLTKLQHPSDFEKQTTTEARGDNEVVADIEPMEMNMISISAEEIEMLRQKMASAKELESELVASSATLLNLQAEVAAARESEERLTSIAAEASANLIKTIADLERSRLAEVNAMEVAQATTKELEEVKLKLQKMADENASLPLVVESLKAELEKAKLELMALKKKESKSTSAALVGADLEKAKVELSMAISAEAKAKEAIASLTTVLQKVTVEATEARVAANSALQEAETAKLETEQARTAMSIVELQLEAAVKEIEVAKEAEALAVQELKSFKETTTTTSTEKSEPAPMVSKEDYDALNKRLQETEDLANKRVAAVLAQIDVVEASKLELQEKFESAKEEVEANNLAAKDALQRAEKAAAAKTAVENELRKRRTEREQRRKITEGTPVYSELLDCMPQDKIVQLESLARVLQIRIPPIDEKTIHVEEVMLPKRGYKRTISRRVASFISRKRN